MVDLQPGLYLIGTPIGNMGDCSSRAIEYLERADFVACEDTREMKKFLTLLGIEKPSKVIFSIHEHNENQMSKKVLDLISKGHSVAYTSDAGMPAISDPGQLIVKKILDEQLYFTCAPGPTALTTAIALSGIAFSEFTFYGFFPRLKKEQVHLMNKIKASTGLIAFYESPKRLHATLEFLKDELGESRKAVVARELTKKFEEIKHGSISELSTYFGSQVKGECVVLIEPQEKDPLTENDLNSELVTAMKILRKHGLSSRDAIEVVGVLSFASKNRLKEIFLDVDAN